MQQDTHGVVACLDETRHGLEDGDAVTFTEIQGMTELNGAPHRAIKVTGSISFLFLFNIGCLMDEICRSIYV
jgi:ubiquitin-activating enzyme E1